MSRRFDFVTFDCYGTLVDWEQGIGDAFLNAAAAAGKSLDRAAVLEAYAEIEPVVEAETFRSYREVLDRVACDVAHRFDWDVAPQEAGFLADSLAGWKPFPDTAAALKLLERFGYRLGILSNVDDDLLRATLQQFDVSFELLVTAERVHSYKPHPGHFQVAERTIGDRTWLHAAQSYFHDVIPATRRSIPVAWINRKHEAAETGGAQPRQFPDLMHLADWLCCIEN